MKLYIKDGNLVLDGEQEEIIFTEEDLRGETVSDMFKELIVTNFVFSIDEQLTPDKVMEILSVNKNE